MRLFGFEGEDDSAGGDDIVLNARGERSVQLGIAREEISDLRAQFHLPAIMARTPYAQVEAPAIIERTTADKVEGIGLSIGEDLVFDI